MAYKVTLNWSYLVADNNCQIKIVKCLIHFSFACGESRIYWMLDFINKSLKKKKNPDMLLFERHTQNRIEENNFIVQLNQDTLWSHLTIWTQAAAELKTIKTTQSYRSPCFLSQFYNMRWAFSHSIQPILSYCVLFLSLFVLYIVTFLELLHSQGILRCHPDGSSSNFG